MKRAWREDGVGGNKREGRKNKKAWGGRTTASELRQALRHMPYLGSLGCIYITIGCTTASASTGLDTTNSVRNKLNGDFLTLESTLDTRRTLFYFRIQNTKAANPKLSKLISMAACPKLMLCMSTITHALPLYFQPIYR